MNESAPAPGTMSPGEPSGSEVPCRGIPEREIWRCENRFAVSPPGRIDLALPHEGILIREAAAEQVRPEPSSEAPIAQLLGVACGVTVHPLPPPGPLPPTERWIRGRDLTAVYEPGDERLLRITATWRRQGEIESPGDAPADSWRGSLRHGTAIWQLILSAQTALLESSPSISVVTRCPWGTVARRLGPAGRDGVLLRLPTGLEVLVAVHPIDLGSSEREWPVHRRLTAEATGPDTQMTRDTQEGPAAQPDATGPERMRIEQTGESLAVVCRLFASPLEKGVLLRGRVLAAIGPAETKPSWAVAALAAFQQEPPPLNT